MPMRTLRVWTIQLAKWRLLNGTDIELVNITLASGWAVFAPTPELLGNYKRGRVNDEGYRLEFRRLCWVRMHHNSTAWDDLVAMDKIALACYCPADTFCHRLEILAPLEYYCKNKGIEFEYCGEITV